MGKLTAVAWAALAGVAAAGPVAQTGSVHFRPAEDQAGLPEKFRLGEFRFPYKMSRMYDLPVSGLTASALTFPSPVKSPHEENNTVHAEYYRPAGKGPFPGVILLDVLGGDQTLSRGLGLWLAQNDVAALFVQMAYYGPRRPKGPERVRLLSPDLYKTMDAMRQTVLDCRCAAAWLAARPEVNPDRIGILGTSLGSFMAALTGAMEPRVNRVALLLGGGGFADGYFDHPKAARLKPFLESFGGKEKFAKLIAPVDPLTHAARLGKRNLLMIAARRDVTVPAKMARALWEATGKQRIVWIDTDHYGSVLYVVQVLARLREHFIDWGAE